MRSHGFSTWAEVWVRRYRGTTECDVVVVVREQTMVLRLRDFSQAVKWAKIACKSYKIPDDFSVELVAPSQPQSDLKGEIE